MPAKLAKEPEAKPEVKKEEPVKDLAPHIARTVLQLMGKPSNLHEIRVKHLWDNRYRVNVWCSLDSGLTYTTLDEQRRITDSYFVYVSPEGGIIKSDPPIQMKYTPTNPTATMAGAPKKPNIADILKP